MKRLAGMLLGAFVGDALALSTHWIYDTEKIRLEFNGLLPYKDPVKSLFHSNKKAGDFTHYGDQSLLLLKSISTNDGFDNQLFKTHWLHFMKHYEGYIDQATDLSIEALSASETKGSTSNDLGGITRIAPIIYYHFDDSKLLNHVKKQTELTHNDLVLIDIGKFTATLVRELIIGHPLVSSIEKVIKTFPSLVGLYEMAQKRVDDDLVEAVKDIGQSCSCQYSFPSALIILLKHHQNFEDAMEANILCGGDSAARGMLIGMLLGASLGIEGIPKPYYETLSNYATIHTFIKHKTL